MAVVLNLGDLDLTFVLHVYYELILILSDALFSWLWLVLALVGLLVAFVAHYCKLPAFVPCWPILSPPVLVSRIRRFLAVTPRVFLLASAVVVVLLGFVLHLMMLVLLALVVVPSVVVLEFVIEALAH